MGWLTGRLEVLFDGLFFGLSGRSLFAKKVLREVGWNDRSAYSRHQKTSAKWLKYLATPLIQGC